MVRPIGDLIGHCFYSGELRSDTGDGLRELELALPAPITWFSTSFLEDRQERLAGPGGVSFANPREAALVVLFLERLSWVARQINWVGSHHGKPLSVMAISGYRAQVATMEQRINTAKPRLSDLDIQINTIDASQGREADIVVFSVVRSNKEGRLGFLESSPRVNVALSRGKYGLALFGDFNFCETSRGPLAEVSSYIRSHPQACKVVEESR
jgi:hypothetical protein